MVRLCDLAAQRWPELDREYHSVENIRGQKGLARQPLERMLWLIYAWAIEKVNPEKLNEWISDLDEPLPWQDVDSEAVVKAESDSFYDMMNKSKK